MEKCPDEVLALIFELAGLDDAGETAREIGLVSRRLRCIAEPLELRTVALSGHEQLSRFYKAKWMRIKNSQGRLQIWHLFICELLEEDEGMTLEMYVGMCSMGFRGYMENPYLRKSYPFWIMAASIIDQTSSTLRSLSLLASDLGHWIKTCGYTENESSGNILLYLSAASFPKLASLTIVHDPRPDLKRLTEPFIYPALPSLRRLRVLTRSPVELGRVGTSKTFPHPLLQDFQQKLPDLEYLSISCDEAADQRVAELLLGRNWQELPASKRTLPGKLRCVVVLPRPPDRFLMASQVTALEEFCITGLEARRNYPVLRLTWYGELFTDWIEFQRAAC